MTVILSRGPADTESLGESWGRVAGRGLVVALNGDLGAGKTALVRGLARGLGCTSRVHSPTFTLVNVYEGGRLPLFHLDLYRLETAEQLYSAGVDEYLQPDGIAVIEWAERLLQRGTGNAGRRTGEMLRVASSVSDTQPAIRNIRFVTI